MITADYARAMARYNRWQIEPLWLRRPALRRRPQEGPEGFFGSIHKTLNHAAVGRRIWMHRFTGSPRPPGTSANRSSNMMIGRISSASAPRFDATIIAWADGLDPRWLEGDSPGTQDRSIARHRPSPKALLVAHMFNHQTHHRGQVHCMLTQCGVTAGRHVHAAISSRTPSVVDLAHDPPKTGHSSMRPPPRSRCSGGACASGGKAGCRTKSPCRTAIVLTSRYG